jgi:hypothetical protein
MRGQPLTQQSKADVLVTPGRSRTASFEQHIDREIQTLMASLPNPERLSPEERRGIVARYTAVLEGNFIYWMTAAYLSVASDTAHAIIRENLLEEVRDNHPGMLRKFAMAADAMPNDGDGRAVYRNLEGVRRFVGQLSGTKIVIMMAFFEGWIQRFMPYLAELAGRLGSTEREYTDVHGEVDVVHTRELFRALDAEMDLAGGPEAPATMLEGIEVLRTLIQRIVHHTNG